ncbi:hypothetical protein H5410_050587 [Solanum commersonii]|uniref:Uncharacterized protein n=1 Tax=Solanum commersonii TaxID=4109 RepID=A0A9J5WYC0_SOLCO|nr:hypothetical protein H5410_050587 [Solanum commersonii]
MAMSEVKIIEFEEGWEFMQKGITKLKILMAIEDQTGNTSTTTQGSSSSNTSSRSGYHGGSFPRSGNNSTFGAGMPNGSSSNLKTAKGNQGLYYDYCHHTGHTSGTCYRLHGYPANFKHTFKKKSSTSPIAGRGGTAHYAAGDANSQWNRNPASDLGGYAGGSINTPNVGSAGQFGEGSSQMISQGPYTSAPHFTPEQYHQLLHLLDQDNESNGTTLSASVSRDVLFKEDIFPFRHPIHKSSLLFPVSSLSSDYSPPDNVQLHMSSTLVHEPLTACAEAHIPSDPVPSAPPTLPLDVAPRKSHRTTKPPIWMQDYNKPPNDYSQQLYENYRETFVEYINYTVLLALGERHNKFILREIVKRWANHKIMIRWLSRLYDEIVLMCFRDLVYEELKGKARDAFIIDRQRLLDIFVGIGMEYYQNDFEDAMLKHTATYYS